MRWIFFTLLVVNIGVFAYMQLVDRRSKVGDTSSFLVSVNNNHVNSLVLLSELNIENKPMESIRVKNPSSPAKSTTNSRSLCTLVGAFPNISKAERFVEKLAALGVGAKIKHLLVSSTVGYWLHLPPQTSRKEALRRLSELQRQGVDSYIIPDGNLVNGISLGMFSEEKRANELKNSIVDLGYQPEILSVPRERREFWILLSESDLVKISTEIWLKLISEENLLQKQQNLCSDVASASNFL